MTICLKRERGMRRNCFFSAQGSPANQSNQNQSVCEDRRRACFRGRFGLFNYFPLRFQCFSAMPGPASAWLLGARHAQIKAGRKERNDSLLSYSLARQERNRWAPLRLVYKDSCLLIHL